MKKETSKNNRLARNFHLTFIPERQYINSLLRFCASGGEGSYQEISKQTGIPMGKSSGKVPAILNYCIGMGLIVLSKNNKRGSKKPEFTTLGRTIYLNDPFLKEGVTQWACHLNLCDPISGADVWYHCFLQGVNYLGMSFSNEDLKKYVSAIYGTTKTNMVNPMVRMYSDDASFSKCGALQKENNLIIRKKAPISSEYSKSYGAWLLELMKKYFPERNQISVIELEKAAGWLSITGWNSNDMSFVLELIQRNGLIEIDRTMEPWLLTARKEFNDVWKEIYDDVI